MNLISGWLLHANLKWTYTHIIQCPKQQQQQQQQQQQHHGCNVTLDVAMVTSKPTPRAIHPSEHHLLSCLSRSISGSRTSTSVSISVGVSFLDPMLNGSESCCSLSVSPPLSPPARFQRVACCGASCNDTYLSVHMCGDRDSGGTARNQTSLPSHPPSPSPRSRDPPNSHLPTFGRTHLHWPVPYMSQPRSSFNCSWGTLLRSSRAFTKQRDFFEALSWSSNST